MVHEDLGLKHENLSTLRQCSGQAPHETILKFQITNIKIHLDFWCFGIFSDFGFSASCFIKSALPSFSHSGANEVAKSAFGYSLLRLLITLEGARRRDCVPIV